ncbi:glycogen synthase GlgA [Aureimonas fodinaquatilis]|uniref:Glycogen synthase n=1 Tax=Aureimonas fodinaquatilis TaxID=2565783 RepID=A0A5B0E0Y1_9HYPH|nr:glycogen synthase GlgA [Aureimonas fodinaquatilis]KAA0972704.1 glycogen synthase GlgA [Aureimonas fodinaquatilis]
MSVLSVASEVYPLVKTGGLADVAGALPQALNRLGGDVRTLLPAYPDVLSELDGVHSEHMLGDLFGGSARILSANAHGLDLLLLDAPHLYDRPGGPYVGVNGYDHPDNWARFAALGKAAAAIGFGALPGWQPNLVHAHDWQAALAPVYLAMDGRARPSTVVTIHNLAFQGAFPHAIFSALGLPDSAWSIAGVEYYGTVGYLKGGLHAADMITTVSPTYATEILTPAGGMGLDGLLRGRSGQLHGIVNGVDVETWNPATDRQIASNYSLSDLPRREANKRALEQEFGFEQDDSPILAVVSRLTWQKGLDILAEAVDEVVARGFRLVVVGSGDQLLEGAFLAAAARYPGRVGVRIGYDEPLSHRVQAGADALLVPSRFEPCGLTQLYALRYGCLPVVSRVGGLADTVIDANIAAISAGVATGVIFEPVTREALLNGLNRLKALYSDQSLWRNLQKQAMSSNISWDSSARRYADLFRQLLKDQAK